MGACRSCVKTTNKSYKNYINRNIDAKENDPNSSPSPPFVPALDDLIDDMPPPYSMPVPTPSFQEIAAAMNNLYIYANSPTASDFVKTPTEIHDNNNNNNDLNIVNDNDDNNDNNIDIVIDIKPPKHRRQNTLPTMARETPNLRLANPFGAQTGSISPFATAVATYEQNQNKTNINNINIINNISNAHIIHYNENSEESDHNDSKNNNGSNSNNNISISEMNIVAASALHSTSSGTIVIHNSAIATPPARGSGGSGGGGPTGTNIDNFLPTTALDDQLEGSGSKQDHTHSSIAPAMFQSDMLTPSPVPYDFKEHTVATYNHGKDMDMDMDPDDIDDMDNVDNVDNPDNISLASRSNSSSPIVGPDPAIDVDMNLNAATNSAVAQNSKPLNLQARHSNASAVWRADYQSSTDNEDHPPLFSTDDDDDDDDDKTSLSSSENYNDQTLVSKVKLAHKRSDSGLFRIDSQWKWKQQDLTEHALLMKSELEKLKLEQEMADMHNALKKYKSLDNDI